MKNQIKKWSHSKCCVDELLDLRGKLQIVQLFKFFGKTNKSGILKWKIFQKKEEVEFKIMKKKVLTLYSETTTLYIVSLN